MASPGRVRGFGNPPCIEPSCAQGQPIDGTPEAASLVSRPSTQWSGPEVCSSTDAHLVARLVDVDSPREPSQHQEGRITRRHALTTRMSSRPVLPPPAEVAIEPAVTTVALARVRVAIVPLPRAWLRNDLETRKTSFTDVSIAKCDDVSATSHLWTSPGTACVGRSRPRAHGVRSPAGISLSLVRVPRPMLEASRWVGPRKAIVEPGDLTSTTGRRAGSADVIGKARLSLSIRSTVAWIWPRRGTGPPQPDRGPCHWLSCKALSRSYSSNKHLRHVTAARSSVAIPSISAR